MTMQMLKEADDKQLITITPQWMKQKFDEMNQLLFNGMLPECKLSLFTTGKGSQGHTLGWFKTHKEYQVRAKFVSWSRAYGCSGWQYYLPGEDSMEPSDFAYYMNPEIQLNGNYNWTEKAALSTLVHEMCHYKQHLFGFYEGTRQKTIHHGVTFESVAREVSRKSNEFFTVERLARAEQMDQMDFTDAIKAKHNASAAKGIHFLKFELAYPETAGRGGVYKFAYAIPASTIAEKCISYFATASPDRYKRIVHCVTTDGTIKRYPTVKGVGKWYYSKGNSIEDVMPDVKVDSQEELNLGGEARMAKPWYIFRMKYKTPYKKGYTLYPWAYYIVEFQNFFAVKNYIMNTLRDEFVYADYTEVYDPKIQSHKPNNIKNLSVKYISTSQDIQSSIKQSEPTVIFDNQNSTTQQQSPLASFLYGNGGNPHLQYAQQKAAQQQAPVKRYTFTINLMSKDGTTSQFTVTNATEEEAKQQMRQRFPNWSEQVINDKFSKYAKVV